MYSLCILLDLTNDFNQTSITLNFDFAAPKGRPQDSDQERNSKMSRTHASSDSISIGIHMLCIIATQTPHFEDSRILESTDRHARECPRSANTEMERVIDA